MNLTANKPAVLLALLLSVDDIYPCDCALHGLMLDDGDARGQKRLASSLLPCSSTLHAGMEFETTELFAAVMVLQRPLRLHAESAAIGWCQLRTL